MIAPASFGGGAGVPFSDHEVRMICSTRRALERKTRMNSSMLEFASLSLAPVMDRPASMIADALRDSDFCKDFNQVLLPSRVAVVDAKPFAVNTAGYPVSSNLTWNACIDGTVTLEMIKANPDKSEDGNPRDCSWYHTGAIWKHPDLGVYFTWSREMKQIQLPQGYVLKQDVVVVQK